MIILRSGLLEYVIKLPFYELRNNIIFNHEKDKTKEFNIKSIPIYERLIDIVVYFHHKSKYVSEEIRKIGFPRLINEIVSASITTPSFASSLLIGIYLCIYLCIYLTIYLSIHPPINLNSFRRNS
jgi:hypothetical protein